MSKHPGRDSLAPEPDLNLSQHQLELIRRRYLLQNKSLAKANSQMAGKIGLLEGKIEALIRDNMCLREELLKARHRGVGPDVEARVGQVVEQLVGAVRGMGDELVAALRAANHTGPREWAPKQAVVSPIREVDEKPPPGAIEPAAARRQQSPTVSKAMVMLVCSGKLTRNYGLEELEVDSARVLCRKEERPRSKGFQVLDDSGVTRRGRRADGSDRADVGRAPDTPRANRRKERVPVVLLLPLLPATPAKVAKPKPKPRSPWTGSTALSVAALAALAPKPSVASSAAPSAPSALSASSAPSAPSSAPTALPPAPHAALSPFHVTPELSTPRRRRTPVNYAMPSLRAKMRRQLEKFVSAVEGISIKAEPASRGSRLPLKAIDPNTRLGS